MSATVGWRSDQRSTEPSVEPLSTTTTSRWPAHSVARRCSTHRSMKAALFQHSTTARTRAITGGSYGGFASPGLPLAVEGCAHALLDGLQPLADQRAHDAEGPASLLGLRGERLLELVPADLRALEGDDP